LRELLEKLGYAIRDFSSEELGSYLAGIHPEDRARYVSETNAEVYSSTYRYRVGASYSRFREEGVNRGGHRQVLIRKISGGKILELEKKASDSLAEFYRQMTDTSLAWIMLSDSSNNIILWNQGAGRISGYEAMSVIGSAGIWEKIWGEGSEPLLARFSKIMSSRLSEDLHETPVRCRSGRKKMISWCSNTILNTGGKVVGVMSVGVDVTRMRQAEELVKAKKRQLLSANRKLSAAERDLKQFNEQLENKVRARTRQLRNANTKLQKIYAQKLQFLNQIAHDIRTPLTPVTLLLPTIRRSLRGSQRQKLDIVLQNVGYLDHVAKETLTLSKLDAGEVIHKEVLDISGLISFVVDCNNAVFRKEHIKLTVDCPGEIKVQGDRIRLTEVLQNLVSNSIKYIGAGKKHVHIAARISRGHAVVSVSDSGIGLRRCHLRRIFDEFYKVGDLHKERSPGLGLHICKRIIHAHGGTMSASSAGEGKGSMFTFRIPLVRR